MSPLTQTSLLLILLLPAFTLAKTVTYDFNITWTTANPDGLFARRTIGINNQWPLPTIEAEKGDRLVVNMINSLGDQNASLHFHGLFQNGTGYMDGPPGVTQCDVAPGQKITYDFNITQAGTYWYHSHTRGQYPDGLRGPLIIHDHTSPHTHLYDSSLTLTFSDWYHSQMSYLRPRFLSVLNPTGAEPVPNSALINDSQNVTLNFEPGKRYLIRMVNLGAFAAQYVWFEGHEMSVVEVDGVYTKPVKTEMLYLTAAQRVAVVIEARNDTGGNFAFVGSMDQDLFDTVPKSLNPNVTGWIIYDDQKPKPTPKLVDEFNPLDDFLLVPEDGEKLLENPDYSFTLDVEMDNLKDGANYAFFNKITYVHPKVPTLYTALTAGELATNPKVYGYNTHPYVLEHNQVIEIILNNKDPGKHPFHLHGHNFQVVHRSAEEAGVFNATAAAALEMTMPKVPMRRDVILVRPNGNLVLRFRADNPGVWLFHCHIEWHVDSGLVATMVEAPLQIQKNLKIPTEHLNICKANHQPIEGNAAGNTKDLLDLTGENKSPERLPDGFTTRGIVALVFSVLSALLGMAVIGWYGIAEIPNQSAMGVGTSSQQQLAGTGVFISTSEAS